RAEGPAPAVLNCIHAGAVASVPLAFVSTQTSSNTVVIAVLEPVAPPNTTIRLEPGSYTALWCNRGAGGPPVGSSWIQADVPPIPLAFVNTQTSFRKASPRCPPNTIIRLEPWSYTAVWSQRAGGVVPAGESWIHWPNSSRLYEPLAPAANEVASIVYVPAAGRVTSLIHELRPSPGQSSLAATNVLPSIPTKKRYVSNAEERILIVTTW